MEVLIILFALSLLVVLATMRLMIMNVNGRAGILFRWQSFWIGLDYSISCKRYCLNIIPCVTIWWCSKNGLCVDRKKM